MDLTRIWEEISQFELEDGTRLGSLFKSGNDKIQFCLLVIRVVESNSESYERFTNHLAKALLEFGKVPSPGGYTESGDLPQNAITLWRHTVNGLNRVADRLTAPPEK